MKERYFKNSVCILDDDWFEFLKETSMSLSKTSCSYVMINTKSRRKESLHRVISGAIKGEYVDHINSNKLDNRFENLRICTFAQNMQNRDKRKNQNKSSKYKGVFQEKRNPNLKNTWGAKIKVDGKTISLKYHATEKEAAQAYNEAAIKYHGEFARLNVID